MPGSAPAASSSAPSLPSSGPAPTRAAFVFIFITVLLDMLALGIIVPVLPRLIVASRAATPPARPASTACSARVWAAMQFIFSPVLGSLSDRFGRRPVILLSNLGLGLDYLLMALAPTLAVAVRRPRDLGHHLVELRHGHRLHRRRDAAGEARRELRHARRRVRPGLHRRADGGRPAGQRRPARAVLGRGGAEPRQLRLRLFHPAGIAAAGAAVAVPLAAREPDWLARRCCASHPHLFGLACAGVPARCSRTTRCRPPSCCTRTIATCGTSAPSASCSRWSASPR